MNAINFPCFDSDSAWFSAWRVIGIVPPGWTWDIVAGPDAILGLCFWRTKVRWNHFTRIVTNAVDDEFFHPTQTRSTTARVAFVAPWIGLPGNGSLYFYLIVIEPVPIACPIWIIIATVCVRAGFHEAPLVIVRRLGCVTLAIIDGSDYLRELQEDFTLVLSDAYTFAARHGAWTEISRNEPAREFNFTTLNHDDNLEVRILKIIRQIESNRFCCLKRAACLSEQNGGWKRSRKCSAYPNHKQ